MGFIPIVSRLRWVDYQRLAVAVLILVAESILRLVAWIVPVSILDFARFHIIGYVARARQLPCSRGPPMQSAK